jgi:predicted RNA-binding protein
MCQATVYLDGKEIMQDVMLVGILPEGVRLRAFFDAPIVVPAVIRQIDLLKHRIMMETIQKGEDDHGTAFWQPGRQQAILQNNPRDFRTHFSHEITKCFHAIFINGHE